MNEKLEVINGWLKSSPGCFFNIAQALCDVVCSPDHGKFMNVNEVVDDDKAGMNLSLIYFENYYLFHFLFEESIKC